MTDGGITRRMNKPKRSVYLATVKRVHNGKTYVSPTGQFRVQIPVLPELVLLTGSMVLLMIGAYGGQRTTGLVTALAIVLFTRLGVDSSLWTIRGLMLLRGFCMGFAFVPMQAASYATIPPSQNGRASSLFSTQRQVGVSFGVAILASVLTAHMSLSALVTPDQVDRAMRGVHLAFGLAVLFAVVAAVAAWGIRDSDAQATMAARARPARA